MLELGVKPQATANIYQFQVSSINKALLVISLWVWDSWLCKALGDEGILHVCFHNITIYPNSSYHEISKFVGMGRRKKHPHKTHYPSTILLPFLRSIDVWEKVAAQEVAMMSNYHNHKDLYTKDWRIKDLLSISEVLDQDSW